MVVAISAGFIALCAGISTVYLVLTLQKMNHLAQRMNEQLNLLLPEAVGLLRSGKTVAEDTQMKLQTLRHFFSSLEQAGNAIGQIAGAVVLLANAVNDTAQDVDRSVRNNREKIREIAEWIGMGSHILRKYRMCRNSKTDAGQNHF